MRGVERWMGPMFRAVTRLEEICLATGILGIALLTIANVLLRSIVGQSLLFAEEVSRFLIVFVTFVGIGYAASKGRHIRMTALYDAMPLRARKVLMLFITASTSLLLFSLTWLALRYTLGTVRELGTVSPVLRVPRYLVYLSAPFGFFLGGVQYLLAFVKNLYTSEVYLSFEKLDEYDEAPPSNI